MEHIEELEKLGVAPPERVPMVYVVEPALLTTGSDIKVNGDETSGEVEFYLIPTSEGLLVGVGSDHTDRRQEAIDVAHSKTLCPKVISSNVWRYADLKDHWDSLQLSSNAGGRPYQKGSLDSFLAPEAILAEVDAAGHNPDGCVVFGGTLPLLDGFKYAKHFDGELNDPVLGRALKIAYQITT
jgi:hypothetical protein